MKKALGLAFLALGMAGCASHRDLSSGSDLQRLAPDVYVLRGGFTPGQQPDGNTVLFDAPKGLVVVDTGRHAAHTQKIIEAARTASKPVTHIINTHWHLDHVSGNAALRTAFPDVRILGTTAIEEAMNGFLARYRNQLENEIAKASTPEATREGYRLEMERIDAGPRLFPNEPLIANRTAMLSGRSLELYVEAHSVTAGDVWLFDPKSKTLVAGDLVTLPAPFMDTACIAGWKSALARIDSMEFTTLVPGHGAPMSRAEFESYRDAFDDLLACGASSSASDECVDGWIRAAGRLIPEEGQPFARSLVQYYVDQHLRGDAARNAELCGKPQP